MLHAYNFSAQEAQGGGSLHIWDQQPRPSSDVKASLDYMVGLLPPHAAPKTQPTKFKNYSETAQSLGHSVKELMMNAILDTMKIWN